MHGHGLCKKCSGRIWFQKTYDKRRESIKAHNLRRRKENPRSEMLWGAKSRAKQLGLPFDLTLEDIVIPERCPVLGTVLVAQHGKRARDVSPSLDRIIPKLGYVKGNVRVISTRANILKNNGTVEEFVAVLRYMLDEESKHGQ